MDNKIDAGATASMLVNQMRSEQRSFWGLLLIFFLLLAAATGLIVYNMLKLNTVAENAEAERFRSIGENSAALAELRTAQNDAAYAQQTADALALAGQRKIKVFLAAARTGDSVTGEGVGYAKDHFLGRPLNSSTAAVVASATEARGLSVSQRALLDMAIYDWTASRAKLTMAERAAEKSQLGAFMQTLSADPQLAYYGHAAMAAFYFRDANSDDTYMLWERKVGDKTEGVCSELVKEAEAAQKLPLNAPTKDPEAQGLNLAYWHGQCLRRHGEAMRARADFVAMMAAVGNEGFPDANPLKFQAFHGAAMTSPAVLGEPGATDADVNDAIEKLMRAGALRMSAGMTEAGKTSSTANVGLLMMRRTSPDRYVQTLEYTEQIDGQLSTTWNLVARLVAARAVQTERLPAAFTDEALKSRDAELRAKYAPSALDEIVFHTLAEIAYQRRSSLPKRELANLLAAENQPALDEIDACIGKQMGCYETSYGKAGVKK